MNATQKLLFLAVALSLSVGVHGQFNYKKGYVITNSNDTLHGKINDSGGYKNARVCLFKASNAKKAVKYYPEDIKAFRMIDDKYYVSRKFQNSGKPKCIFIDVLVKGPVSLYKYWKNPNTGFYIEKKEGELIDLDNHQIQFRYKPETNAEVALSPVVALESKAYIDTLHSVFSDAEKVHSRLDNVGYDEKSLSEITKAYLNEVCKKKDCIVYERDLNRYRPRFGLFAGTQFRFMSILPSAKSVYGPEEKATIQTNPVYALPVGGFVNIPLAKINDRLSLQIEIISNGIRYQQEFTRRQNYNDTVINIKTHSVAFPVLLKYEMGRGKLTPSIAVGKETSFVYRSTASIDSFKDLMVHPVEKGGWLAEIGLNYKLTPSLSVFSNIRFQSNRNMIIEDGNQRATYNTVLKSGHFVKEYKTNFSTLFIGLKF